MRWRGWLAWGRLAGLTSLLWLAVTRETPGAGVMLAMLRLGLQWATADGGELGELAGVSVW